MDSGFALFLFPDFKNNSEGVEMLSKRIKRLIGGYTTVSQASSLFCVVSAVAGTAVTVNCHPFGLDARICLRSNPIGCLMRSLSLSVALRLGMRSVTVCALDRSELK
uniref:Uncharacterized protein n=1 Tax=Schistocephalus solidus TaxID=70667 RepID=A0A0V0J2V4_SCHSO